MARSYAIVVGLVLMASGAVGLIGERVGITILGTSLASSEARSLVYIVTGILGLAFALAGGGRRARLFAQVCGPTYTLGSVLGFAQMMALVTTLNLSWTYNTIHLTIGLFGLLIGFGNPDQEIRARIKSYRRR
jgi:hypothetical protein